MRGTDQLETAGGGTSQDRERKQSSEVTHKLETPEGGTSQDTRRRRLSEGHSHSANRRGRNKSEYGKKVTEQGALTNWRPQQKGQVRTQKENNQASGTHKLETAERRKSQDMERKQPNGRYSLSGVHRGQDTERKKENDRGVLTLWRPEREEQVRT